MCAAGPGGWSKNFPIFTGVADAFDESHTKQDFWCAGALPNPSGRAAFAARQWSRVVRAAEAGIRRAGPCLCQSRRWCPHLPKTPSPNARVMGPETAAQASAQNGSRRGPSRRVSRRRSSATDVIFSATTAFCTRR
jgi:hypothetical protein